MVFTQVQSNPNFKTILQNLRVEWKGKRDMTWRYQQIAQRRRCCRLPRQEGSEQERRQTWCWPPHHVTDVFCLLYIAPHHEKRCWGTRRACANRAWPQQGCSGSAEWAFGRFVPCSQPMAEAPPQHVALSSMEHLLPSLLCPSHFRPVLSALLGLMVEGQAPAPWLMW